MRAFHMRSAVDQSAAVHAVVASSGRSRAATPAGAAYASSAADGPATPAATISGTATPASRAA